MPPRGLRPERARPHPARLRRRLRPPQQARLAQHTNVPLDAGYVYGSISPDDARTAAGGYLIATHQALWRYIVFAYKLSATQEMALRFSIYSGAPKSGAPFWVTGSFDASPEFFDISARAPADTSLDQMRLMMQALLADRFHLATHYQTADAPVFALILAKPGVTGPNLQPHPAADFCVVPGQTSPQPPPHPVPPPPHRPSGIFRPSAASSPTFHPPPPASISVAVPFQCPCSPPRCPP